MTLDRFNFKGKIAYFVKSILGQSNIILYYGK